ncbi:MAG: TonB-dependent receptor plug domain-containing protein [Acidobacteriota bacterium]
MGPLCLCGTVLLSAGALRAQTPLEPLRVGGATEITVTSPLPVPEEESGRSVTVLSREEIQRSAASSVDELLALVPGLDALARGPRGVQADLSIRGGTFEQVLVLLDGMPLSDPQTGHHLLDLFVRPADLERVEVLRGPGSAAFGAGAFSGVVNLVTRKGGGGPALAAAMGEHRWREADAAAGWSGPSAGLWASAGRTTSRGWRPDTDLRWSHAFAHGEKAVAASRLSFWAGYSGKAFGAWRFYSSTFPEEYEETETAFLAAGWDRPLGGWLASGRLSWRQHEDHFVLVRQDPDFYQNRHTADTLTARASLASSWKGGEAAFFAEGSRERLQSSNLGHRARNREGLGATLRLGGGAGWTAEGGLYGHHHDRWGWQLWPSASLLTPRAAGLRFFASAGRSFRIPSFTEMYYRSPVDRGNPGLRPESAWTVEGGARGGGGPLSWEVALFRRRGRNLIDWVGASMAGPWKAENLGRAVTDGAELLLRGELSAERILPRRWSLSFTALDTQGTLPPGKASKYVLASLRRQGLLSGTWDLGERGAFTLAFRHLLRYGQAPANTLDARLAFTLPRGTQVFLEGTNLFGERYRGAGGVPMPGRWLTAGIRWGLP